VREEGANRPERSAPGRRLPGMGWRTATWFLVLAVVAASAPAQEWVWRLPALGAAEYRREWRATASDACKTAGLARAAPLVGKVPDRYLHRLAPAPWVCQGELTVDQKALEGPVRDLRDVARAVACDLGSRGAIKGRFPRVLPFGDLALAGSWTTAAPDGTQTLRASVGGKPPATAAGDAKGVVDRLRPFCIDDVDGSLVMRRRVDAAAGRIVGYEAEFDLVVAEGPKAHRRLVVVDRWDLVAVRDNQDADFRKRVAAAIRAGTDFVREAIDEKKSFLVDAGKRRTQLRQRPAGARPADPAARPRGARRPGAGARLRRPAAAAPRGQLLAGGGPDGGRGCTPRRRGGASARRRTRVGRRCPNATARRRSGSSSCSKNVDPRVRRPTAALQLHGRSALRHVAAAVRPARAVVRADASASSCRPRAFPAAARHLLAVQGPPRGRTTLRLATYDQLREAAGTDAPPRVPELSRAAARLRLPGGERAAVRVDDQCRHQCLVLAREGHGGPPAITDRALTARDRRRGARRRSRGSRRSSRCAPTRASPNAPTTTGTTGSTASSVRASSPASRCCTAATGTTKAACSC
jgi:hypothetical protein